MSLFADRPQTDDGPPTSPPVDDGHGSGSRDARPRIKANDRLLDQLTAEILGTIVDANDPPALFQRSQQLVELRGPRGTRRQMASSAGTAPAGTIGCDPVPEPERSGDIRALEPALRALSDAANPPTV